MKLIFGYRNSITGALTMDNVSTVEAAVAAWIDDGSSYTFDSLTNGHVATAKDGDTVTDWAGGAFIAEFVSSTCGSSDCKRFALELQIDISTGYLFRTQLPGGLGGSPIGIGITNTCTGHNCTRCSFTYNSTGDITGCKCTEGAGTCDHTISSAT